MKRDEKHIRIRVRNCRTLCLSDGWTEVDGYRKKHKRKKKPALPIQPTPPPLPLPEGTIIISKNGDFIYRSGEDFWTALLTPIERKLITALSEKGGKLDGNDALKLLNISLNYPNRLRDILMQINRRLKKNSIPLHVSFINWVVFIKLKNK
jgi:hypothetical protein